MYMFSPSGIPEPWSRLKGLVCERQVCTCALGGGWISSSLGISFQGVPKGILSVKAFACFFTGHWRNPILPDKGHVSITVAHHRNTSPSLWPCEGEICSDQATYWSLLHPPLLSPPCPRMLFLPYIFAISLPSPFHIEEKKRKYLCNLLGIQATGSRTQAFGSMAP